MVKPKRAAEEADMRSLALRMQPSPESFHTVPQTFVLLVPRGSFVSQKEPTISQRFLVFELTAPWEGHVDHVWLREKSSSWYQQIPRPSGFPSKFVGYAKQTGDTPRITQGLSNPGFVIIFFGPITRAPRFADRFPMGHVFHVGPK